MHCLQWRSHGCHDSGVAGDWWSALVEVGNSFSEVKQFHEHTHTDHWHTCTPSLRLRTERALERSLVKKNSFRGFHVERDELHHLKELRRFGRSARADAFK